MGSARDNMELTEVPASDLTELSEIGEGGFGMVYRCQHRQWGPVALKRLKADFVQERYVKKLKKEAQKLAELKHPSIVSLFGVVMEAKNYGIVMEYVYHGSLDCFLEMWRPVAPVLKLHITHQIITGMTFLHSPTPGIIHQDLKSLNILITHRLEAKIADFGLSEWRSYSRSFTSQKSLQGTVTHIPPERWENIQCKLSFKFDVYSFGILLWELLFETSPYGNAPDAVIGNSVMRGIRPDHSQIPEQAPSILIQFMQASWKQNPDGRPTFLEMKQHFENSVASTEGYCIELQREKGRLFQRVQEENANELGVPDKWMPHSLSEIPTRGQHWYVDISGRLGVLKDWLGRLVADEQNKTRPQSLQFLKDIHPKVRRTLDEPELREEVSGVVEHLCNLDLESEAGGQELRTLVSDLSSVLIDMDNHNTISGMRSTALVGGDTFNRGRANPVTKVIGDAHQPEDASVQEEDGYFSAPIASGTNPAQSVPNKQPSYHQGAAGDSATDQGNNEEVRRLMRKIGVEAVSPLPAAPEEESPCSQHPEKPPHVGGTVPWTEADTHLPTPNHAPPLPPKPDLLKKHQKRQPPAVPMNSSRVEPPETDSEPASNGKGSPQQETRKPQPSAIYTGNPRESKGMPPGGGDGKKSPPKGQKKPNNQFNFYGPGPLPANFMEGFFSGTSGNSRGAPAVFNIANVEGVQIGDRNIMYVGNVPKGAPNPWGGAQKHPTGIPGRKNVSSAQLTKSSKVLDAPNMDIVAKHLGREWRRVARRLGFSEGQVDAIASDYHVDGLYEQIYQMLRKWVAREGNQATLQTLAVKLWDAGKQELALHIKER